MFRSCVINDFRIFQTNTTVYRDAQFLQNCLAVLFSFRDKNCHCCQIIQTAAQCNLLFGVALRRGNASLHSILHPPNSKHRCFGHKLFSSTRGVGGNTVWRIQIVDVSNNSLQITLDYTSHFEPNQSKSSVALPTIHFLALYIDLGT